MVKNVEIYERAIFQNRFEKAEQYDKKESINDSIILPRAHSPLAK
jgi:hypothetical protein